MPFCSPPSVSAIVAPQRGGEGVSTEEEGVRQVPGEPGRRPGEPEQDPHRRTEILERTLLSKRYPQLKNVCGCLC